MDETDVQSPEQEMVQAIHAEWVQELRDVKNELMHVRELVGVLVRRERSAENKAEVAARRLDRMEREQTEADDAEHEANLQEALANQSKAVKVVVDKWFVDKGYGFGKAPKGEIVFIHASAVQGAEVLTIGTDAWVQVVNDDARAQWGYRAKRAWGRNVWKAERDKENANKVAQQVRRAAALTAELAAQSEKKTAAVCDQPPGLDELAGHIEAPNMGAGGSYPQATMMPDPWAAYELPSRVCTVIRFLIQEGFGVKLRCFFLKWRWCFFLCDGAEKGRLGASTPLALPLLLCWCCCFRSCF